MSGFSTLLRQYRIGAGLSQTDIAEKLGMTRQNYSRYENEDLNTQPTLDLLCKLSDILSVDPNTLIGYVPKFNELEYAYKHLDNFDEHGDSICYLYMPGINFEEQPLLDIIEKQSSNEHKLQMDIPKNEFIDYIRKAHYLAKSVAELEAGEKIDRYFRIIINRMIFSRYLSEQHK